MVGRRGRLVRDQQVKHALHAAPQPEQSRMHPCRAACYPRRTSVAGSMAAVASSRHSTGTFFSAARARHISCCWPRDQALPPVASITPSRPPHALTCGGQAGDAAG